VCYNKNNMKKKIAKILIYSLIVTIVSQWGVFRGIQPNIASAKASNINKILVKFKKDKLFTEIKVPNNQNEEEVINDYKNRDDVDYVEKDFKYKISITPNDTYYDKQWYLKKIKAPEAWEKVTKTSNITIAVIDSGVQIRHPDLRDNIWINKDEIPNNNVDDDKNGFIDDYNGWDFVNNVPDPSPKFNDGATESGIMHGTIIAGIISAVGNNKSGVAGITWDAKIMPLKVLGDNGEGRSINVVKAIDYAIKNGADIINFSFVGFDYSKSLYEAIVRAHKAGIIMIAAAGNEQSEGEGYNLDKTPIYPACHDGDNGENMVIGVSATDVVDQKAPFSSYGHKCVDISAPGVSFYSTIVFNPIASAGGKPLDQHFGGYWSGTSMATPVISGAVAMIEEMNPELDTKGVQDVLFNSADNINRLNPKYMNRLGAGRVNLSKAVNLAEEKLNDKNVEILISPYSKYQSLVRRFKPEGELVNEFQAFSDNFKGGVNITSGDIDGDGTPEIIVGAGFSGGPQVMIFSKEGKLIKQFFAYAPNFRGGVHVACGDVNNDGKDEIITGAGNTGGPHVRVFNAQGQVLAQFFAYDKNFRGGVYVASGDVDGDRIDDIITGAGPGGGPQVRVFKPSGRVVAQFLAYNPSFKGGVKVVVADINGGTARKKSEIIVAPGVGGGPHIRIFKSDGSLIDQFFAYNKNFRGGVNISAADIDKDGFADIITGAGPGGGPHVKVFKSNGILINSFYGFKRDFAGGVNVGVFLTKK